jgi:hypothetical protein
MSSRHLVAFTCVVLLGSQLLTAAAPAATRIGATKPPRSLWIAFVEGASRDIDGEWTGGHATVLRQASSSANESVDRELIYPNAWRGITARISPAPSGLRYSFEVAAGADPRTIHLRYSGVDSIEMTQAGELEIAAGQTTMVHRRPFAYQNVYGRKIRVAVRFVPFGSDVAFSVGRYDRSRPLIIESIMKS